MMASPISPSLDIRMEDPPTAKAHRVSRSLVPSSPRTDRPGACSPTSGTPRSSGWFPTVSRAPPAARYARAR